MVKMTLMMELDDGVCVGVCPCLHLCVVCTCLLSVVLQNCVLYVSLQQVWLNVLADGPPTEGPEATRIVRAWDGLGAARVWGRGPQDQFCKM